MAELSMEAYQEHRGALARMLRKGLQNGIPRERLQALGDRYLADNGLTRNDLLAPPVEPIPEQAQLINPTGARMMGGAMGATAGLATPIPGDEFLAPAITAEMAGQTAELINTLYATVLGEPVEQRPLMERMLEVPLNILLDATSSSGVAGAQRLLKRGLTGPVPRMVEATGRPGAEVVAEARKLGVELPAPVAHPSPIVGRMYEAAQGLPGGSSLDDAVQKAAVQLDNALQRAIESGGPTAGSKTNVGRRLQKGLVGGASEFKRWSRESFGGFSRYFGKGERIRMVETTQALTGLGEELARTPNIRATVVPAKFTGFAQDIAQNRGTLSFNELKILRSTVGDMIDDAPLNPDIPKGQLRNLYRALSQDVENALGAKGPRALTEWKRFNGGYEAGARRLEMVNSIARDPIAADAFRKVFEGAKDGGELLRVVRKTVGEETWQQMRQLKLVEMGLPNPSARGSAQSYDLGVFLTRWNRVADEAKDVLVGGNTALRKNLDVLADTEAAFKQGLRRWRNTSHTAHISAWQRFLQGEWVRAGLSATANAAVHPVREGAGLMVAGVPIAGPYMTAKVMQSPAFVDWLTQGARIVTSNPNGIGAHLGRLAAVAKLQPEYAEPIAAWLGQYAQEVQRAYADAGLLREALGPLTTDRL